MIKFSLSIHLSKECKHLKKGMIMRLDRYTPLRYRVNDVSQLFPALFVSNFTVVRNYYLSEEIDKFPLFLNDQSSNIDSETRPPAVCFLQFKNEGKNL